MSQRLGSSLVQGQRQIPKHLIIEFGNLLQSNNQEMKGIIAQKLSNNIFFDRESFESKNSESIESLVENSVGEESDFQQKFDDDLGYKMQGDGASSIPDDRKKYMATDETIQEDLIKQIGLLGLDHDQKAVARYLIQSVEENGLLPGIDGHVDFLIKNGNVSEGFVRETLHLLKNKLEPAGILAESVKESLMLQVDRMPDSITKYNTLEILGNQFEAFSRKNIVEIQKHLNHSNMIGVDEIYQMVDSLNPTPIVKQEIQSLKKLEREPDFIVKKEGSEYRAYATKDSMPEIPLNREYARQFDYLKRAGNVSSDEYKFLDNERRDMNDLVSLLRDRKALLEKVVTSIINSQKEYISSDNESKLDPLLQKDIAETFGLDPSTVSKIAREKLIVTEEGKVIKLSELFSLGVQNNAGVRLSHGAVMDKIQDMVDKESKKVPMTDIEMEKKLKEEGIKISSTTIRTLRGKMNIPDPKNRLNGYSTSSIALNRLADRFGADFNQERPTVEQAEQSRSISKSL